MTFTRIAGTGSYLPEKVLSNKDLEKMVDTSDEWIVERTGIKKRHILAEDETCSTMAEAAAKKAIESAGIDPNDIGLIIVATCTQDYMFPSTACVLQNRLNINANIPAFDVSAACAGFIYALNIADQYIKNNTIKSALIVGSDALSRVIDWQDRSTCVLFGDGAGAVVLEASDKPGVHTSHIQAQGKYQDILYLANKKAAPILADEPDFVSMKGNDVFKLAVTELGKMALKTIEDAGFEKSDIDWMVPHQANLRIIQSVAKRIDLPLDKIVLTLAEHGNTSSASIPLALDVAIRDGRIKRGHKLLLEAIGGGMAWGSALVTY